MKNVSIDVYESDNGSKYLTEKEALVADAEFWKNKAEEAAEYIKLKELEAK